MSGQAGAWAGQVTKTYLSDNPKAPAVYVVRGGDGTQQRVKTWAVKRQLEGATISASGTWESRQNKPGEFELLADPKGGGQFEVRGAPAQPPAGPPSMGYAASDPSWAHGGAAPPLPAFPGQPGQGGPPATSGGSGGTRMGIMAAVSLMREVFHELTVSISPEQAGPMTTSLFIAASEGRLLDDRPEEPGEDGGEV